MRLIDVDKLEAYGTTVPKECNAEDYLCGARDVLEHIDSMPTVDAVPVRHGKWLPENRTMDAYWVCSCCGFPSEAHGAFKIYKFCPNCGADMRGADNDTAD